MYEYIAKIQKVYDGDSVTCRIYLGFGVYLDKQKLRLLHIDAPELRGETLLEGRASRDFLREQIQDKVVRIKTHKDKTGKYGRWLAEIYLADGTNINTLLVESGHAIYKEY